MAPTGLAESFLAAVQASLSVLLVISYGGIAGWLGLLHRGNTKAISKLCVRFFLPALLITKIGAQLDQGAAARYLIIFVWAVAAHLVSFALGLLGHHVLGMPEWVTAALMFNNTTSYPLLLLTALAETGILQTLIVNDDESASDAVERAKSYFLVFATVSSCLTFAVGPRLVDSEHAPDSDDEDDKQGGEEEADRPSDWGTESSSSDDNRRHGTSSDSEANEGTGLLSSQRPAYYVQYSSSNLFFPSIRRPSVQKPNPDRRALIIPRVRWEKLSPRARWWLLLMSDFFNAPLVGAILGAIIGLVPGLQRLFFAPTQEGGFFTAWLTSSWKNIAQIFVPLPVLVTGATLFMTAKEARQQGESIFKLPWLTVGYILLVRFVLWPVASIACIYLVASKTDWLGNDPMLWFTMMLMPTGPPASKLMTLVQVSGAGPEELASISKLQMVAYIVSPLLSFTVVGSLVASRAGIQ